MTTIVRGRGRKKPYLLPAKTHEQIRGAATPRTGDLPQSAVNSILLPQTGGVGDQGQWGLCTGKTLAEVMAYAYVGQTGLSIQLSGMFAYIGGSLLANQFAGLPNTAPIDANGAEFMNLVLAAQAQGLCLESVMPYNPTLLSQKENYLAVLDAAQRKIRVGEVGAIDGSLNDQGYINALCQSLLPYPDGKIGATIPTGIASSYPDFDNADGTTILVAPPTSVQTDHEVELVDYNTVTAVSSGTVQLDNGRTFKDPTGTIRVGDRVYRLQNHWSEEWAPQSDIPGTVLVHQSFMIGQRNLGGDAMVINAEIGGP